MAILKTAILERLIDKIRRYFMIENTFPARSPFHVGPVNWKDSLNLTIAAPVCDTKVLFLLRTVRRYHRAVSVSHLRLQRF